MRIRFSSVVGAFVLLTAPIFGAASPATQTPVAVRPAASDLRRAIINAKALFKAGDMAGGETALFAANRHADGTPEGYRDSGAALVGVAFMVHEEGDAATSSKIAAAALDQLDAALAAADGNPKLAANVYGLLGLLQERLLGARAQAEANYRKAVQLSASSVPTSVAALHRLEAEDFSFAARAKRAKAK